MSSEDAASLDEGTFRDSVIFIFKFILTKTILLIKIIHQKYI